MARIALHTCCAPCASSCLERLMDQGYQVTLFFSNSNIHPESEYLRRLREAERLAELYSLPLETDSYDHSSWLEAVKGFEEEPEGGERCSRCFAFSLSRCAGFTRDRGIGLFTTSLTVSPHKNSRRIHAEGSAFEGFLPEDFKKKEGFARSLELSRKYSLYRQPYCGCDFSISR